MIRDSQSLTVATNSESSTIHDISRFAGPGGLPGLLQAVSFNDLTSLELSHFPVMADPTASWCPPIPRPNKIFCVGLNFGTHAAEVLAEIRDHPTLFTRFPSTFVGHRQPLLRPSVSDTLDWEGEIAVVIGAGGRNIGAENASEHVLGYTVMGENSIREWQLHSKQATAGKNFDNTGSWGPWIVTRDEIADPSTLEIVTELNGVEVQHGKLADLVFDIPTIIEYVSAFTELSPGDVIATGTPAGIGHRQDPPRYLKPGDNLVIRIPGLLELINDVTDEPTP
jgi:2-keto-4-pentenoate hydratase/2-oxohepta-3-ene-1,7-dioic acid hydratase in catechol pathway